MHYSLANRLAQMAYRARKRAKGLCIYGGCSQPTLSFALCRQHLDKQAARKRLRQVLLPKPPPRLRPCKEPGCLLTVQSPRHLCPGHRLERLRTQSRIQQRKRNARGLCNNCGQSAVRGGLCEKHHKRARERYRAWRERKDTQSTEAGHPTQGTHEPEAGH